jgi:hypothetical protein
MWNCESIHLISACGKNRLKSWDFLRLISKWWKWRISWFWVRKEPRSPQALFSDIIINIHWWSFLQWLFLVTSTSSKQTTLKRKVDILYIVLKRNEFMYSKYLKKNQFCMPFCISDWKVKNCCIAETISVSQVVTKNLTFETEAEQIWVI